MATHTIYPTGGQARLARTSAEEVAKVVPGESEGEGESTEPRVGPHPADRPVETAPPNVPEFKPAFAGQTRAKALHTRTQFRVAAADQGPAPKSGSLGHRNVLGAALDAKNRLWVAEMGPRGGDQLDLVDRGKDYGWSTIGYGEEYSGEAIHASTQAPGLQQPVYYWDPVISVSC